GKLGDWQEVKAQIAAVPGVVSVSAYTQHQAMLSSSGAAHGILVQGIEKDGVAAAELTRYLEEGTSLDQLFGPTALVDQDGESADLPALMVGRALSLKLGLMPGTAVSLVSPQVASSPFGLVPRFRRFLLAGVYKSGLSSYEEGLVYADLSEAQRFFRMGDAVSGIEVKVADVDRASVLARKIMDTLGGAQRGFYVQDWSERNRELWDAIGLEKRVYFIVLLLLVVLASFSIVSTLVMIVLEKRRDIAIMKTMGAKTSSIANIFRVQGTVIGLIGTSLGLLGGYFGSIALREYGFPLPQGVFPTDTVPVQLEWINFTVVGVAALLICAFSTLYPAWRASRLEPSEVLRYE
ncbi:MAG: ABC transporter permease, partial [Deltaproteobacteria bacterium]|nr:ABC transporter permease [Deltaproteobacteria bacterium]